MAKAPQRKCRDVLCCMLMLVFWIGMIIIGAVGFKYGNPERLVYGVDYQGNVCGTGAKEGAKFTVYPRLQQDFLLNLAKSSPLDYTFYGVCVSACPGTLDNICNYNINSTYTPFIINQCLTNTSSINPSNYYTPPAGLSCATVQGNCWISPIATSSVFYRCVPVYNTTNSASATCVYPPGVTSASDPACVLAQSNKESTTQYPAQTNQLFDAMNTVRQTLGRYFGDLKRAWWVILLCAVGITLVFGFTWLMLAKWFTAVFVWGTITLVLLLLGFLTGYFYYKGGLIHITLPTSIQAQLDNFSTAANGAANTISYVVPQSLLDEFDNQSSYRIIAYVSTAVTLIALLIVVTLRRAIGVAIKAVKMGAEALQDLPTLVCFPVTTVIGIGLFLVWWVFVAASLATAGNTAVVNAAADVTKSIAKLSTMSGVTNATINAFLSSPGLNDTFTTIEDYPTMNYLLIYHFFGLLWTAQFITGFAALTIAGTVCAWYFSRVPGASREAPRRSCLSMLNPLSCCCGRPSAIPKDAPRPATYYDLETWPLMASFTRTFKFYMGTVAFGSLLIAIMQFIRVVVAYVYKRMKDNGSANNTWVKFICCCLQCCLAVMEKCIQFISRNAYIYTAMKGSSFCESGGAVFRIIVANATTLAAVNILGELVMFLGKVLIAVGTTWIAYAILDNAATFQAGGATPLTSTWLVILINLFFSYSVATAFMIVFDLSIDSVLLCYLVDMSENGGRAAHMDGSKFDELQRAAKEEALRRAGAGGGAPGSPSAGGGSGAPAGYGTKTVTVAQAHNSHVAAPAAVQLVPSASPAGSMTSGSAAAYA